MFPEPRPPALSRGRLDLTLESASLALIAQRGEVCGQYTNVRARLGLKEDDLVGKANREGGGQLFLFYIIWTKAEFLS